jgi:phage-related protein
VANLAEKLSLKAGVDDEVIQSGQNVLLTFTKIRNEVGKGNDIFDQASAIALDMSVALGTDLQGSITQVGKALNDPIAGLTALTRAGVQFTDQQKEQIKALVESGDILGAQKVILGELTTQFGGSAAAQATATDKLSVAWGNLQETLGEKLLPLVESFSDWMINTGIPAIEAFVGWIQRNNEVLIVFAGIAGGILIAALVALVAALGPVTLAVIAIGAAVGVVAALVVKNFGTIKAVVSAVWNWIKSNWPLLLGILTGPIGLAVGQIVKHWNTIRSGAKATIDAVAGFFTGLPHRIAGALGQIPNLVRTAMSSALHAVQDFAGDIVDAIWSIPRRIIGVAGAIRSKIAGALGGIDLTPGFDLPGFGGFLAEGGVVTRPTMAVIGEAGPEAVIPLSRAGGAGLGGDIHIHLEGAIIADERQFKDMVRRSTNELLAVGAITKRGARL